MKQTVEEAARENILFNHRTVDRTLFGKDLAKFGEMNFVQGVEWQSKQSPWISVNERLPEPNCCFPDVTAEFHVAFLSFPTHRIRFG